MLSDYVGWWSEKIRESLSSLDAAHRFSHTMNENMAIVSRVITRKMPNIPDSTGAENKIIP